MNKIQGGIMLKGTPKSKKTLKDKTFILANAQSDVEAALELFRDPDLSLGLSYKDLLRTIAAFPLLVTKLLNLNIEGLETDASLITLMDGQDLTLLGSQHESVMRSILEHHADKLLGVDLLTCARQYPNLRMHIFTDDALCSKLSGRQLAELGSLDNDISQQIKDTPELWERITTNPHINELVEGYQAQKDSGEISEGEFARKCLDLLNEEKTFLNVGVLCQNHSELAAQLVSEGFLDKLSGEDLSFFAQYHEAVIEEVFKRPELTARLEGNDFKRLGLNSEHAARKILESKELMEKSGPHVWSQLASKHKFFYETFITTFDLSVRQFLDARDKHQKSPAKYPPAVKGELMRLNGDFFIALAENIGPKFVNYLYDQAVHQNNPVFRYVFQLDETPGMLNIENMLQQLKQGLKGAGKAEQEIALAMAEQSMILRNQQLAEKKDIYLCTLAGLSQQVGLQHLDTILGDASYLKALDGNKVRAIGGKSPAVIMKILNNQPLLDKLSGAHLADMACVHPKILDFIWSNPVLKDKIVLHFNIPKLAGRSLNILRETAEHRGFLDEIMADAQKREVKSSKGVPPGYTSYLYNILYARAEVVNGVMAVLEQTAKAKADAKTEEQVIDDSNAPSLTASYELSRQAGSSAQMPAPKDNSALSRPSVIK